VREAIHIELADTGQKQSEALAFVERTYQKTFGTTPPPPHIVIAGWYQGQVVGTMGINTCDEGRSLRLEELYTFDQSQAPLPCVRDKMMEYGRWVATMPHLSGPLLFAGSCYANRVGKEYGWCEHSDKVHRAALRLGIVFHEVRGAVLQRERVPHTDRAFYEAEEKPRLYMVSVAQVREALRSRTEQLVQHGRLTFGRSIPTTQR